MFQVEVRQDTTADHRRPLTYFKKRQFRLSEVERERIHVHLPDL